MTLNTNIEVPRKNLLATIAMHVAVCEFTTAEFAEIITSMRIHGEDLRVLIGVRSYSERHFLVSFIFDYALPPLRGVHVPIQTKSGATTRLAGIRDNFGIFVLNKFPFRICRSEYSFPGLPNGL